MDAATRPAPAVYRRQLFHSRDAASDQCTDVLWVQGNRLFCDARFATDSSGAAAFRMGFAGQLECTDSVTGEYEWVHAIAAGEAFGSADIGQLFEVPGWGLLEAGRNLDYVELWQRCAGEPGPVWEATGLDDHGTQALVVCVGDRFGLALGADADGGRPASVHIGSRAGTDWIARYSSWPAPESPRFSITPHPDGCFDISWRAGEHSGPPVRFHPVHQIHQTNQAHQISQGAQNA